MEQYTNTISIIRKSKTGGSLYKAGEFDHPYPCTKILFTPDAYSNKDMLATTGDYLRIWSIDEDDDEYGVKVSKTCVLNSNKSSEYCAPLTSFDWNDLDASIVGTCSIDTTCTIWDIAVGKAKTQLIAHDREVYDMAWANGKDVFASVGADGSVRMFDLRSLEHSTIIYESPNYEALLRLEWNKKDPNYIATFGVERSRTVIIDIRRPSIPLAELGGHVGPINSVAWAPHSPAFCCTVADDKQALIWDLRGVPKRPVDDPILAYSADGEINNMHWSIAQPDWVSITYNDKLQILRV